MPKSAGKNLDILKEVYSKNLELHRERKRIAQILSQVAEKIFVIDDKNKVTVLNEEAKNLFGLKEGDLLSETTFPKKLKLLLHSGNLLKPSDFLFLPFNKSIFYDEQNKDSNLVTFEDDSQTHYFRISYSNIEFEDKKECVVSLTDITDEVEMDKQKDEFVSIASHELKTPISIIKTNLWMLKHFVKDMHFDENQTKFMNEMERGLDRLNRIVTNLLDISRIEQGRFVIEVADYDIDGVVSTSADKFDDIIKERGLRYFKPKKTGIGVIKVDKDRFVEVLDNFISNAIKYTDEGGIKVAVSEVNGFLRITVTDSGPGIDKNEQKRLFKKFSRAKAGLKQNNAGASTGLGLYISKRIIEEMGGEVGVLSKVGKGSTFWFKIPIRK